MTWSALPFRQPSLCELPVSQPRLAGPAAVRRPPLGASALGELPVVWEEQGVYHAYPSPSRLPPGGLAPDHRDRDMPHRRLRLGAVPMPLAGLDLHYVPHVDLHLLLFVCDIAGA
jgi:hypothetical protein